MTCNIDERHAEDIIRAMVVNCDCKNETSPSCQLRMVGRPNAHCIENSTTLCRSSVSNLGALFINSPNINECKGVDRTYKQFVNLWESCTSEYSFNVVSYRVDIIFHHYNVLNVC